MGIEELDRMSKKTREKYLEIVLAIPVGRRLELTAEFCDTAREFVLGAIRSQRPDATEQEVRREYISRVVPEDLRRKAYGW